MAENLKLPTTGDNVLYSVFGFIALCLSFILFSRSKKNKITKK
ncbi:LPXTG cell wall anchor domain-containing protein [Listeria monocytogenes]|nr:LPXTG cell wall anchor domain-containing protein [Listeria monocytogenes]